MTRKEKKIALTNLLEELEFELTQELLERIAENRRLIQKAWDFQPVEKTPVTCFAEGPKDEDFKKVRFNLVENLRPQLLGIKSSLENGFNILPGVVRDFNTTLLASAFGCPIRIMPNGQDWAEPIIKTNKDLENLKPSKVLKSGLVPEYLEDMDLMREVLPREITIGNRILLGPTDHLFWVRGANAVLLDFYMDPEFITRLYDLVTESHILLLKESHKVASWNFSHEDVHFDTLFHAECKGLITFSDDASVNVSPKIYHKFIAPFNRRLLEEFRGGLIHTCGACEHLLEEYAMLPATGIELNLNLVNYQKARRILKDKVIVSYFGLIPSSSYEESLRLTIEEARKGGLIVIGSLQILKDLRSMEKICD